MRSAPVVLLLAACASGGPPAQRAASPAQAAAAVKATPPAEVASPPTPPAASPGEAGRTPRIDLLLSGARTLRAGGDLEGAREVLEAAVVLAPGSSDARLELAGLLAADGRELDRAEALIAKEPPGTPRVLALQGQLAETRGDDARATEIYAASLAKVADPDVRVRRAIALERLGRGNEALVELHKASRERPGDPMVRARLAERYEAMGLLSAAETELTAAAEATPDRAGGWDHLARFYARTGRPEKAKAAEARARKASGVQERALRPLLRSAR